MRLRYERGGLADLDEIFAYIAADNRQAAGRVVARIERVGKRIAASPRIGESTLKPGFLRFPVGKYLIVYEVGNDEVIVHYVRHGARPRPWGGSDGNCRQRSGKLLISTVPIMVIAAGQCDFPWHDDEDR
jgi:toxin ParE1/3/4